MAKNSYLLGDWSERHAGTRLDLTGFQLTFEDNFDTDTVGVSGASTDSAKWFAPVRTPFGAAAFASPNSAVNPFSVSNGALTITMEQVGGAWQSGHMQSINSKGEGFAQQFGYFEMRAKFPPGAGSWPAFWLLPADRTVPRIEIDIVEAYGDNDYDGHHAAIHIRPAAGYNLPEQVHNSEYTNVPGSMFDGQYHTYGGLVTPEGLIIYYDGVELIRLPGNEYMATPLYMCVDLAMFQGEVARASGEYEMVIDYVRAYALPADWRSAMGPLDDLHTGDDLRNIIDAGSGGDTIHGMGGQDYLRGGEGNDSLGGGDEFDDLNGNAGADSLTGGAGGDWVVGGRDGDFLAGEDGDDIVYGNLGADTCDGGIGDDLVRGGLDDDLLRGGAGRDWLSGDRGADTVTGGEGADIFHSFGEAGTDFVTDFDYAAGDRVVIASGAPYSVAQYGADVVVAMEGGGQLTLAGVHVSSLGSDWISTA